MPEGAHPQQDILGGEIPAALGTSAPSLSLPQGGGGIRGIGEKFATNPVTGTGSLTVPIFTSPGRSNFTPHLSLSYDSGSGNGAFGFGWTLSLPAISRKTDKGLPQYRDAEESDIYLLSGAEDLTPVLLPDGGRVTDSTSGPGYTIHPYRPRIEGLFARIERWIHEETGEIHWRSITRDNVTTLYGKSTESRIAAPDDARRVFTWLPCESYDDRGNAIVYEYATENDANLDRSQVNERHRDHAANRYLKRIKYGNQVSRLLQPNLKAASWLFEVVFDYDEEHYELRPLDPARSEAAQHRFVRASAAASLTPSWASRPDPFSSYRAGFEVRTYRRCHRILMFHRFAELGDEPYLVRATELDYADLDYSQSATIEAELAHPGSTRFASFIRSITQSGYVRQPDGHYLKKSLPPLEFEYSKAVIQDNIREVDGESLENLPVGLDGATYHWVDLDGEGLSGVLTEQAGAWFYKANWGGGTLGPLRQLAHQPSLAALGSGRQQLLDLAGDGQLDLVVLGGPTPGFYERTQSEDWASFKPFVALPSIPWDDPNLRFVDLNGDGHADVLITEHELFTWYPSLAEAGFAPARRVYQLPDEEQGPRLLFADSTQSIYLADMCGDGLTDLVRIRNGALCYWPNLGYGQFGAKVSMDNAPWFDNPDQFSQQQVRLADIDGSGTTDILYLGRDGARLYFNQSGNRWSAPRPLPQFPPVDSVCSVMTVDLLGNGTACLLWSSPLPGAARHPLRYIALMGEQKPHLMVKTRNNLGAETHVSYASSTKFYLADKAAGTPWLTRLPFPVHVIERVERYDSISRSRFVTRYAYHHGYFDGDEREFRGFGMVEQWDTESFSALRGGEDLPSGDNSDASSYVPPIHTKSWFHTGVYLGRDQVSNFFAGLLDTHDQGEYYREPARRDGDIGAQQVFLPDTLLPPDLSVEEEREACRALKGALLRQEVYALDGTDKAVHPYTVTEQNFTIKRLQPRGAGRHVVFFTHERETIRYHYERNPADPRISHTLTLEVDNFGNLLRSLTIAYPRADVPERQPEQNETHLTLTLARFANRDAQADWYRVGLPVESRTYDVVKPPPAPSRYSWEAMQALVTTLVPLGQEAPPATHTSPYEDWDWRKQWNPQTAPGGLVNGVPVNTRLRLIEHVRTLYRKNDLTALLPLGSVESLALPGESYTLALTPGLAHQIFVESGKVTVPALDGILGTEGRYVHSEGDSAWWIPSGRIFFSPSSAHNPAQELTYARHHFFLPHRYRDPFHTPTVSTETFVSYDAYDLLVRESRDALDNRITLVTKDDSGNIAVRIDYRVLQPSWLTDPNGNRTRVAFDALGMVVGTAVMGKAPPAPVEGDSLEGFEADLTEAVILDHLANPLAAPEAILQRATTRLVYDLFAYHRAKTQRSPSPPVVYTLARETHDSDPVPAGGLKIQSSFSYSDGFGREIQRKLRAEAGPVPRRDANGKLIVGADGRPAMTSNDVNPRWVGSGWVVFNNKGKPVRQYEPFFTHTPAFESDTRLGVSPVLFYDPAERVVATLHPNHTWEKVVFDPWRQETFDANDTVLVAGPQDDPDVGDFFRRLPDAEYLPTWYAQRQGGALGPQEQAAARKAAIHAHTPTVTHFDALGRPFLTVAHNRVKYSDTPSAAPPAEAFYRTRVRFDIEGNQRQVIDAQELIVIRCDYDMLGTRLRQASMEAGERWMLNDVVGKPIRAWDSRGHAFRTEYDPLGRPLRLFVAGAELGNQELLTERLVYGEQHPASKLHNLRGALYLHLDQAGAASDDAHDFKGNSLRATRRLARQYREALDWRTVDALQAALPTSATALLNLTALEAALAPLLEAESYTLRTTYDALNRPLTVRTPDNSVMRPTYNEANLLERVDVMLRGATVNGAPIWTPFVTAVEYNTKGQRTRIDYGNGVRSSYTYDPLTFRLVRLLTQRDAIVFPDDCPQPPPSGWPGCQVQNLSYTYDPVGNITHIRDDAQQILYFRNKRVEPSAEYTYDAFYRLIEATGREHLGQAGAAPLPTAYHDRPRVGILFAASDGNAMGRYLERYVYDAVGNFQEVSHRGSSPVAPGWTRRYGYNEPSLLEPGKPSNRLTQTTIGTTTERYSAGGNGYDAHGNMLRMPQLQRMQWDFGDRLHMTQRQAVNAADADGVQQQGQRTWYVYDANGQRVRKVTELATGQIKDERIYLGGFELYRKSGASPLVRETLHLMDDQQRIALVETRVAGSEPGVPRQLIRYQFGNHLGSASLELDQQARLISYEEYTPYGSTSYQAVRSQSEVPKRYRYTGKERDEESGLYYHGARYYAPWVGRWTSCDPAEMVDGTNLYAYVGGHPIRYTDSLGMYRTEAQRAGFIPQQTSRDWQNTLFGASAWWADKTSTAWTKGEYASAVGDALITGATALAGASVGLLERRNATPEDFILGTTPVGVVATGEGRLAGKVAAATVAEEQALARTEAAIAAKPAVTPAPAPKPVTSPAPATAPAPKPATASAPTAAPPSAPAAPKPATTPAPAVAQPAQVPPQPSVVSKPAPSPKTHGNKLSSAKPHHVYEIHDNVTGKVHKTGVSGQPLNKDGSSPRANPQVNKLNKATPTAPGQPPRFSAEIVAEDVPNRRAALHIEQHSVNAHTNMGNPSPGNALPRPNRMYGPGAR